MCANVVRAQYRAGTIAHRPAPAYREERGVDSHSMTETYVAMRRDIDNWRWAGVPFYLRTGKALAGRRTEIAVKFKAAPFALFRNTPVDHLGQNLLVLRIQPDEFARQLKRARASNTQVATHAIGDRGNRLVLDAYASRDLQGALAVWNGDEEIDSMCTSLFRELLTYMMEDPRNISFCIHLMFCAKNIERIGDHATNIAETVFYMIEGQQMVNQRPKGDMTTFATTVPGN